MARPTNEQQVEKSIVRSYEEIRASAERDQRDNLRVVEMVFANLVALENYTYKDAYREAARPENATEDSIQQMASRWANKPKIRAEINRIKMRQSEEEMSRNQRLAICLDGSQMRDRIALELFAIAMNPDTATKLKIETLTILGKLKHVDAFVGSTPVSSEDQGKGRTFDIARAGNADEARQMLADQLRTAIAASLKESVIEVTPIEGEKSVLEA